MGLKIIFCFSWLLFTLQSVCVAQKNIPVGTWRVHFSYNALSEVTIADDAVVAGSESSLFSYYPQEATTVVMAPTTGYSDLGISALRHETASGFTVIGYVSGNIDLQKDGTVQNISAIRRSTSISGSKAIRHITFDGNGNAFLSTFFGLVEIDLENGRIGESYLAIGPGGTSPEIFSTAIDPGSNIIYALTSAGVFRASLSNTVNRSDFNNWKNEASLPTGLERSTTYRDTVYVSGRGGAIYRNDGLGIWTALPQTFSVIRDLEAEGGKFAVAADTSIFISNAGLPFQEITSPELRQPNAVSLLGEDLWVADGRSGLLHFTSGVFEKAVLPNGPFSPDVFNQYAYEDAVIELTGGYRGRGIVHFGNNDGISVFDGTWKNYNIFNGRIPEPFFDPVSAVRGDDGKFYITSYGYGLLVLNSDLSFNKIYNEDNSILENILPFIPNQFVRPTGIDKDLDGKIWFASNGFAGADLTAAYLLFTFDPKTQTFSLIDNYTRQVVSNGSVSNVDRLDRPLKLVIDDFGNKWMQPTGTGMLVFNENEQGVNLKEFSEGSEFVGLPNGIVNDMVKDLNGDIWVGTNDGVGVFYNPGQAFQSNSYDAVVPVFDRRPLLRDQAVRCITVDGGNRKWIGTSDGIWVFSPNGSELELRFTTENSPLSSNVINDIAVNRVTGEAFIATDDGYLSYRDGATVATTEPECDKVFPNPVSPGFSGVVTVTGLMRDANVRITDISGRLAYQARAKGGTVSWNLMDYDGNRAQPGVYLVFGADDEGEQGLVCKFVVVD